MSASIAPSALVPVLSEIARVASESLDLDVVFQRIATAAGRVLTFDAMTVTLTDEGDGFVLYSIGGAEVTDETRRAYARLVPRAEYSAGLWALLQKTGAIDDIVTACDAAFPRDRELRDSGVRAMLRAPLHAGARTIGYLLLLSLAASRCSESTFRRCANAPRTSCRSPRCSSPSSARRSAGPFQGSRARRARGGTGGE